MGVEAVVNLIFSVSPKHTNEYYAEKAREVTAFKPYRYDSFAIASQMPPVITSLSSSDSFTA
jgi:hypothetical protein